MKRYAGDLTAKQRSVCGGERTNPGMSEARPKGTTRDMEGVRTL